MSTLSPAPPAQSAPSPAAAVTDGIVMAGDDERRRALRRMKGIALSLLLFAAVVFVGCVVWQNSAASSGGAPAWVGYVRATAEASMVGALADWFAVTALFRRPLGLPIPHTAIIPTKKDQIGESLGDFVQSNFLTGQVLAEKLGQLGVSRRVGEWLGDPDNSRRLGANVGAAMQGVIEVMRDEDVQAAVDVLVIQRIKETPAAPILGQLLDIAVDGQHHQNLLTSALRGLGKFLDENKQMFREKLSEESPDWVPNWVDDRVFAKLFSGLQSFLTEVADDPNHQLRHQVDAKLMDYVEKLKNDPETAGKIEDIKADVLAHPAVQEWSSSLWAGLKRNLIQLSNDPNSELRRRIESTIQHFGRMLSTDVTLQTKVDGWVEKTVIYVVEQYKGDIADLISGTVARWDTQETSDRIELQVGRDLQFIRINGTVVGALAGLVIYSVSQLF